MKALRRKAGLSPKDIFQHRQDVFLSPATLRRYSFYAVALICLSLFSYMAFFPPPDTWWGTLFNERGAALLSVLPVTALALSSLFFFVKWRSLKAVISQPKGRDYYLTAMEAVADGICVTDRDWKIIYVNQAFCHYHGYRSSYELTGRRWLSLFGSKEQRWLENFIFPVLIRQWKWTGRTKGLSKAGTVFDQELSIIRFRNGGYINIMRDISSDIEAQDMSETRLAAIEAAQDGIGIVNERGVLTYLNKALMDIHGILEQDKLDYIGRPWENLYSEKGQTYLKEVVLPQFEREGSWRGESVVARLSGGIVYAELSLTRLPGGGMIGTARDITDRKRAEEERAQLKDQFYQAQKMEAIGRLAGGIAHDFNNILAAMLGYSEFLLDDLDNDSRQHEYVRQVLAAGGQARELVDNMLAFSRRSEMSHSVIDLLQPFEETGKMLTASVPRTIELDIMSDVNHAYIQGNSTQIGQVLMNLCVNSKDAIEDEHGKIVMRLEKWRKRDPDIAPLMDNHPTDAGAVNPIKIIEKSDTHLHLYIGRLSRSLQYAKLTVEDTGSGITRTVAEHIFEPFYTTKSVNEGTGLGMSMAHGVILEHQGALFMDTRTGGPGNSGTKFEIFFPLTDDNELTAELEDTLDVVLGSGKILIVEDQENVRSMMHKMITRLGYEAESVESPGKALEHLNTGHKVDLVITDYTMPKMTGIELAQQISSTQPNLPIILVSGYSQKKLESAAELSPNIKGVLRKPVRGAQLSHLVSSVLKGHDAENSAS